ncbi:MAG: hypothetical protein ACLP01_20915 [Solirubrobacteraceae bacterium]
MERFDAELYLRLRGEEMLLSGGDRHRGPWGSPLNEPASALLAVGAITAARAEAVTSDYTFAQALRNDQGATHRRFRRIGRRRTAALKPLEPRRVVACERSIEHPQGLLLVHHVTLSSSSTEIAITWRPAAPNRARRIGSGMAVPRRTPGHPPSPRLADDHGTSATAQFSGGGSDIEWEGHFTADPPLADDTAWIDIDGERVELTAQPWTCETTIEPLPEQDPAHAYLWLRLACRSHFHDPPEAVGAAIDALLAAGALGPDDPVLDDVRAVDDALPRRGFGPPSAATPQRLPAPWRSLLARKAKADGPEGTVSLGAVTPLFDGFSVAVEELVSYEHAFTVDVEVTGLFDGGEPFQSMPTTRRLAWWAADDRRNHYLGTLQGWSGGGEHLRGKLEFRPCLDPKAKHLRIMPTGSSSRAVISFELPWAVAPPAGSGRSR